MDEDKALKETSPLLNHNDDYHQHRDKSTAFSSRHVKILALTLLSLFLVVCGSWVIQRGGDGGMTDQQPATAATEIEIEAKPFSAEDSAKSFQLSVEVTNEYSNRPGFEMFPYPFLEDAHLMEPYRESTVTVSGLPDDCGMQWRLSRVVESDSMKIERAVSETEVSSLNEVFGGSFTVTAGGPGQYSLVIEPSCDLGSGSYEFAVWVKYVRRELMSLTEEDREEFLDAMKVLWEVNTVDGKALYGADYKSAQYLALIHNDGGGNPVCDEFHGDVGFLNNHVMLGAYLEQSLQLVNKRTCLHYMEYTKYFESEAFVVGHRENAADGGTWTELMTSKWFGSNEPLTGRILDGRWANLQTPLLDDQFFADHDVDKVGVFFPSEMSGWYNGYSKAHVFNPYGLLRSTWNFDPKPYVLRFNNMDMMNNMSGIPVEVIAEYDGVSCNDLGNFMKTYVNGQSLSTVLNHMEYLPHGSAHFTIGGSGGVRTIENDAALRKQFGFTANDLMLTARSSQSARKMYITNWFAGEDSIFSCTPFLFDFVSGTVTGTAEPGEEGGMSCDADPKYLGSDEAMNDFLELFYAATVDVDLLERLKSLDVDKKEQLIKLLASRIQYDGDLTSSAGAIDPIFWVFHGAVERLFQRIVFEGVLSDKDYTAAGYCSGHVVDGTKLWLQGYSFADEKLNAANLTNGEITQILDPTSDQYPLYVNSVYESRAWNWCPDFDSYFDQ